MQTILQHIPQSLQQQHSRYEEHIIYCATPSETVHAVCKHCTTLPYRGQDGAVPVTTISKSGNPC